MRNGLVAVMRDDEFGFWFGNLRRGFGGEGFCGVCGVL